MSVMSEWAYVRMNERPDETLTPTPGWHGDEDDPFTGWWPPRSGERDEHGEIAE